jgi:hypothetical protein
MILPDDLIEGARPQPDRQRRLRGEAVGGRAGEQVLGDAAGRYNAPVPW